MTALTKRSIPDGFQIEWNSTVWNVGYVFQWSEFYEDYLDCNHRITIKPGETLPEAYERETGESFPFPETGIEIFFLKGME